MTARTVAIAAAFAASLMSYVSLTPSSAADLGGNCCADLEERIAELEATTARKGNRKVSLTISGYIAEQIAWWDDGVESNVYNEGIGGTTASHVNFSGEAKIDSDWSAGYLLRMRGISTNPFSVDQNNDAAAGSQVNAFYSYWWLKNTKLGKVSVGLLSPASDNAAIAVDQSGSLLQANWAMFDGSNFKIADGAGGYTPLRWKDVVWCGTASLGTAGDCTEISWNAVRYDTPAFGGFSASASFGQDDLWDVIVRYNGEVSGFKLAAAVSFARDTTEQALNPVAAPVVDRESDYVQAAAYAQHLQTGLFGYVAFGHEWNSFASATSSPGPAVVGPREYTDHNWYYKAGIRQKFVPLGNTVLYGEYGTAANMLSPRAMSIGIVDADFTQWGLGAVQEIDAAAMSLWIKYRNYDVDASFASGAKLNVDTYDTIVAGAVINF